MRFQGAFNDRSFHRKAGNVNAVLGPEQGAVLSALHQGVEFLGFQPGKQLRGQGHRHAVHYLRLFPVRPELGPLDIQQAVLHAAVCYLGIFLVPPRRVIAQGIAGEVPGQRLLCDGRPGRRLLGRSRQLFYAVCLRQHAGQVHLRFRFRAACGIIAGDASLHQHFSIIPLLAPAADRKAFPCHPAKVHEFLSVTAGNPESQIIGGTGTVRKQIVWILPPQGHRVQFRRPFPGTYPSHVRFFPDNQITLPDHPHHLLGPVRQ